VRSILIEHVCCTLSKSVHVWVTVEFDAAAGCAVPTTAALAPTMGTAAMSANARFERGYRTISIMYLGEGGSRRKLAAISGSVYQSRGRPQTFGLDVEPVR
jgi:hypothetical protein